MPSFTYHVRGNIPVEMTVTIEEEDEEQAKEQATEMLDATKVDVSRVDWDDVELDEALDEKEKEDDGDDDGLEDE